MGSRRIIQVRSRAGLRGRLWAAASVGGWTPGPWAMLEVERAVEAFEGGAIGPRCAGERAERYRTGKEPAPVAVTVRVDDRFYSRIASAAKECGRTVPQWCRIVLWQAVERDTGCAAEG